jgi:hypothetical protein
MPLFMHHRAMVKSYTVEMVEFIAGKPVKFAPSFGAFRSLMAAEQAAALRMALSAPRINPVGYRILDQQKRELRCWPAARRPATRTGRTAAPT